MYRFLKPPNLTTLWEEVKEKAELSPCGSDGKFFHKRVLSHDISPAADRTTTQQNRPSSILTCCNRSSIPRFPTFPSLLSSVSSSVSPWLMLLKEEGHNHIGDEKMWLPGKAKPWLSFLVCYVSLRCCTKRLIEWLSCVCFSMSLLLNLSDGVGLMHRK